MIARHGDLVIKPIEVDKSKLKFIGKHISFTLAEGETTGHKHTLTAEPSTTFNVYQDEKGQYVLEMEKSAELSHQEHNTIKIIPGMYVVEGEQEYDYFFLNTVKVQD